MTRVENLVKLLVQAVLGHRDIDKMLEDKLNEEKQN